MFNVAGEMKAYEMFENVAKANINEMWPSEIINNEIMKANNMSMANLWNEIAVNGIIIISNQ